LTGVSAKLKAGDRLLVRDCLFGLMLPSGNDAAVAIAGTYLYPCMHVYRLAERRKY